jgi:hypothetical protein
MRRRLRSRWARSSPPMLRACRPIWSRFPAPPARARLKPRPRTCWRSTRACSSSMATPPRCSGRTSSPSIRSFSVSSRARAGDSFSTGPAGSRSKRRRCRSSISCSSLSATARWLWSRWSGRMSTTPTTSRGAARCRPIAAGCSPRSRASTRPRCRRSGATTTAPSCRTTSRSWMIA